MKKGTGVIQAITHNEDNQAIVVTSIHPKGA